MCDAAARPSGAKAFDSRPRLWQGAPLPPTGTRIARAASREGRHDGRNHEEPNMPKQDWGTKRICPTTGKRFYDLNKTPIVSPYTGEVVDIESARRKIVAAVASRATTEKDDDDLLVDDLDTDDDLLVAEETDDADADDDLLEDDADDNVSLDDIADVSGPDDDS
jgi:hypothetical protein